MRQVKAKKLRRIAESQTVGRPPHETRWLYRKLKKWYKLGMEITPGLLDYVSASLSGKVKR